MSKKADLFGSETLTLVEGRALVDVALGIALVAHESDYHGGEYFRFGESEFAVVLKTNFVEDDGERTEAEYPKSTLLLYLTGEEGKVSRLGALAVRRGFKLLRSSVYK
jgi:hypothetical protein